jgi:uncharacterized surface protein with fasciclin (FAS1) repeats
MDRLTKMKELTLFAPSNAAWKDTNLNNFIRDRKRMSELLNMHLVEEKLTLEKIVYNNKNQVIFLSSHIHISILITATILLLILVPDNPDPSM